MGLLACKAYDFFYGLSLVPTEIELTARAKKYERTCKKEEKKDTKVSEESQETNTSSEVKEESKKDAKINEASKEPVDDPKVVKEEIKKATKDDMVGTPKEGGFSSDELAEHAAVKADGDMIKKMKIIDKSYKTDQIIAYALYYITHPDANLIKLSTLEMQLVNTIADKAGYGKVYESQPNLCLEKYDPSCVEFEPRGKFFLLSKDIDHKITPELKELVQKKLEVINVGVKSEDESPEDQYKNPYTTDENGLIHPVFFTEESVEDIPKQGANISDDEFELLENTFAKFLENKEYYYKKVGDMVMLCVKDGIVTNEHMIDPGIVMGLDKFGIIARYANDSIFVPVTMTDIVQKVIENPMYNLTVEEYQRVIDGYFRNMNIYRYIDMSNTGKLADWSKEDFQKLGKKLTFIINLMKKQTDPNTDAPRLRFNLLNSVDDFMLISDPSVKSPITDTSQVVVEGLMYICNGDDIQQKIKDHTIDYHIDKYGDM